MDPVNLHADGVELQASFRYVLGEFGITLNGTFGTPGQFADAL
jgi:hypothetical protein